MRYFVAVAEEMHFNRAAARLHIAQPALSQQIQQLERELKTQLFIRTTRSVALTDAGKALLPEARRVLAGAEHARAAVDHASAGRTGPLRMGFVSSAALQLVPDLVIGLKARWPHLGLHLREATTEVVLEALGNDQMDVGLVREIGQPPQGIEVQELGREALVVAVPDTHRLAGRASVRLEELTGEGFVVFPRHQVSRLFDHIAALCHRAGVRFHVAQEAVQFPTILGLVAARTGIAVVPEPLQCLQIPGVQYLALADEEAFSTVSLVYATSRSDTALIANCRTTAAELHLLER